MISKLGRAHAHYVLGLSHFGALAADTYEINGGHHSRWKHTRVHTQMGGPFIACLTRGQMEERYEWFRFPLNLMQLILNPCKTGPPGRFDWKKQVRQNKDKGQTVLFVGEEIRE